MKISELKKSMLKYSKTLDCKQGVWRIEVTADIYHLMEKKGMNKAALARLLKTSKSNVTMLLSGDRNLTLNKVFEIYYHLGERPMIRPRLPEQREITDKTSCSSSYEVDETKTENLIQKEAWA